MDHKHYPAIEIAEGNQPSSHSSPTPEPLISADIPKLSQGFADTRDSIDEGLTGMDLRIRLRDDFESWKKESFDLMSAPVQKELGQFLRDKRALFECGCRKKLAPFLIEVIEMAPPAETEWRR
ncbi:hypothetical protein E4U38_001238 [Claviceps purpurea]|nr:hypothetical protein E4U38_001238 [Claviceps purpurea]